MRKKTKKLDASPADLSLVQLALQLVNLSNDVHNVEMSNANIVKAIQDFDSSNLKMVQDINRQFEKLNARLNDLEKAVGSKSEVLDITDKIKKLVEDA